MAFGLVKRMSIEDAAKKIGGFYADEISDRLLNAAQLAKSNIESELLIAHLDQKTQDFSRINFLKAIPIKRLKQTALFSGAVMSLLLIVTLISGNVLREGSQRIIAYNQEFTPPNPYEFKIIPELKALRNNSFPLSLEFSSEALPLQVFLWYNGRKHEMLGKGKTFHHQILSVKADLSFYIQTGAFKSAPYVLTVIDKPWLVGFDIELDYPSYTKIKDRTERKSANLVIPEGTTMRYRFYTEESQSASWAIGDSAVPLSFDDGEGFIEMVARNSFRGQLNLNNEYFKDLPPHLFSTQVIPDDYPSIAVNEAMDSLNPFLLHFSIACSDDYGIKKVNLNFVWEDSSFSKTVYSNKLQDRISLFESVDLSNLPLKKSGPVELFFEVFDNDAINGSKSKISKTFNYSVPDDNSVEELKNELAEELEDLLSSAFSKSKELQQEQENINQILLENKELSWDHEQKISNFLQKQESLRKDLHEISKKSTENSKKAQFLSPEDQELLNKQKKLDALINELLDDETLKMFDEMQKLLKELAPEKAQEQIEKLQLQNENLNKSLDRTLELFKQMEVQEKIDNAIEKLENLSEKEKALSEKNESIEQKEQDQINKEFERLEEELRDLQKKNDELENRLPMDSTSLSPTPVKEQLKKANEELKNDRGKNANENQKKAGEEMQKLAQKLSQHQKKEGGQEDAEDLQRMRQLLENLIFLSVEQEKLLSESKNLSSQDPKYIPISQKQRKLKDDAKIIEDSLFALSKRQVALSSFINKELHKISFNAEKAIGYLADRRAYQAVVNQQFVMTSANNLALILDESIQQMQDAAMKEQFETGSCNKPGGKNPKPGGDMQQLKDQLSKQIEQMKKQLEKQGNKPGEKGKKGAQGAAKSFAEMAAEQAAIREKLSKLQQQLQQNGRGGVGQLDQLIKELESGEKDLYNQELSRASLLRQQQILTRLLEAEKAIQERDLDDKRESKTAKMQFNRNPEDFLEYKKTEISEEELLKILLPSLNLFYKKKVNEYFNGVD